jgi:hypothetical protein
LGFLFFVLSPFFFRLALYTARIREKKPHIRRASQRKQAPKCTVWARIQVLLSAAIRKKAAGFFGIFARTVLVFELMLLARGRYRITHLLIGHQHTRNSIACRSCMDSLTIAMFYFYSQH